jgi:tRNA A37 methylthiotransferase MiaB
MARKYLLRTYGCQMNEHDSERIAGLLEADGMQRATGLDDADVVVLNTCCIRENADNKLYGNLGHLKTLKHARPDQQIVVAGCLAQKDRDQVRERRSSNRRDSRARSPRSSTPRIAMTTRPFPPRYRCAASLRTRRG